jgi:hypothetical protein
VAKIQRNAATLGSYLQKPDSEEGRYVKKRIRMGKCFVIASAQAVLWDMLTIRWKPVKEWVR